MAAPVPAVEPAAAYGAVRSRGLLICGVVLAVVSVLAIAAGAIAAVISLN
jgi:hypothetical protein